MFKRKLILCGYFPKRTEYYRQLGKFAMEMCNVIFQDDRRLKTVQLTFMKNVANWDDGFAWLFIDGKVEILIPRKYKHRARWLIVHELCHAKQMAEGRINRNLDKIKYTNKSGVTKNYIWVSDAKYFCKEDRRHYDEYLPWETEANTKARNYGFDY